MTRRSLILALDQGTTSSRSIIFDGDGTVVAKAQREVTQHFPQPGWVEHDATEIWSTQWQTVVSAMKSGGIGFSDIAAVGITNQRETVVLWDRVTGVPLGNAIVWQDRRTAAQLEQMSEQARARVGAVTGLLLDPYFSASKLVWMLDHIPSARARAERGELAAGTIDSWLLWNLTRGAVHGTDVSNASRTMLFDIRA
ncbi:MAG: glycerol kinase, partial [Phycisphaerales bacterium]|nr:glycerol kinase [Phycisphaerales bacterium]